MANLKYPDQAGNRGNYSNEYLYASKKPNPMGDWSTTNATNPARGEQAWAQAYNVLGAAGQYEDPGKLNLKQQAKSRLGAEGAAAKAYQMSALSNIQNVMNQGGMTTEDKARLQMIQQSNAIREQGQRNAIAQQAAQRGVGGSGLALQQLMANQQQSAQSNALQGTDVAAQAQARQRQAGLDLAAQSQGMRGQDIQVGAAQDLINQFNTGIANQQRTWNQVGAGQQKFSNAMDRATAQANILQAKQGQGTQQRQQNMGLIGQLGSAAMGGR